MSARLDAFVTLPAIAQSDGSDDRCGSGAPRSVPTDTNCPDSIDATGIQLVHVRARSCGTVDVLCGAHAYTGSLRPGARLRGLATPPPPSALRWLLRAPGARGEVCAGTAIGTHTTSDYFLHVIAQHAGLVLALQVPLRLVSPGSTIQDALADLASAVVAWRSIARALALKVSVPGNSRDNGIMQGDDTTDDDDDDSDDQGNDLDAAAVDVVDDGDIEGYNGKHCPDGSQPPLSGAVRKVSSRSSRMSRLVQQHRQLLRRCLTVDTPALFSAAFLEATRIEPERAAALQEARKAEDVKRVQAERAALQIQRIRRTRDFAAASRAKKADSDHETARPPIASRLTALDQWGDDDEDEDTIEQVILAHSVHPSSPSVKADPAEPVARVNHDGPAKGRRPNVTDEASSNRELVTSESCLSPESSQHNGAASGNIAALSVHARTTDSSRSTPPKKRRRKGRHIALV
jgi:hypothetical protein